MFLKQTNVAPLSERISGQRGVECSGRGAKIRHSVSLLGGFAPLETGALGANDCAMVVLTFLTVLRQSLGFPARLPYLINPTPCRRRLTPVLRTDSNAAIAKMKGVSYFIKTDNAI